MNNVNIKKGTHLVDGLILVCLLSLLGCTTPGKIGEQSKFDITAATSEDIAAALKDDGRVTISGGILFEFDSADIAPGAADVIRRVAEMMKNNPDIRIAVVGHTDSTGDYKYNLKLSERRADAMLNALVNEGISSDRLVALGVGQLSPAATNDTDEGRAQNRRVELVLVK